MYRIRKAAEPPTAEQQRIVEAEASRIAALNAATLRASISIPEAKRSFEIETANLNAFLLDGRRPFSFSGKKMGVALRAAPSALRSLRACAE